MLFRSALLGLVLLGALAVRAIPADAADVSRARLPNGLTVLVRENSAAPVVAVSLGVRMGTRWETPETVGLSNFLQLMVVRGTTSRSGIQIVEEAQRLGGSIDAVGDQDWSEISATALSRHCPALRELVNTDQ